SRPGARGSAWSCASPFGTAPAAGSPATDSFEPGAIRAAGAVDRGAAGRAASAADPPAVARTPATATAARVMTAVPTTPATPEGRRVNHLQRRSTAPLRYRMHNPTSPTRVQYDPRRNPGGRNWDRRGRDGGCETSPPLRRFSC